MGEKKLMLGNEAIARGLWEAGVKVASAYPGTPSTEISENLVQYKDDLYCEWAPNEKVAAEVAFGASVGFAVSETGAGVCGASSCVLPQPASRAASIRTASVRAIIRFIAFSPSCN